MVNFRRLAGLGLSLAAFALASACDNLPPVPSGPHTISGVVTQMTSSGRVPIRGAFLQESLAGRTAVTDDNGRYRLAALPAGDASIQISMLRFETASRSVTVSGDTVLDIELQQREQFTLSGFVTEELTAGNRVPVAGVLVQVEVCPPQRRMFYLLAETETDINGFYSISGMCDGETSVTAWKTGYDLQPTHRPCGGDGVVCNWVTVAGNTRFDLQLSRQ